MSEDSGYSALGRMELKTEEVRDLVAFADRAMGEGSAANANESRIAILLSPPTLIDVDGVTVRSIYKHLAYDATSPHRGCVGLGDGSFNRFRVPAIANSASKSTPRAKTLSNALPPKPGQGIPPEVSRQRLPNLVLGGPPTVQSMPIVANTAVRDIPLFDDHVKKIGDADTIRMLRSMAVNDRNS